MITMHQKYQDLQQAKDAICELAHGLTFKGGSAPEAETKAAYIKRIIAGEVANNGQHDFKVQTNYLVCEQCGLRTFEALFQREDL